MIFGRPGSGKSTFSKKLQKIYPGYPIYHLDKYFFISNWQERPTEEFMEIQRQFVEQPEWIIDGNSIRSLETRYARADLVIYFSLPCWLCLWRIIKRRFKPNTSIDDRADNCPDKLNWRLVKYTWQFEQRVDAMLEELRQRYPQTPVVVVRSNHDVKDIFRSLETQ